MRFHLSNPVEEGNIYPGAFISILNPDELLLQCQCHTDSILKPRVNIREGEHITEIAMAIPGVKKEEIFARIDNGILNINVIHECEKPHPGASISFERYERNIPLPKNADTLFITAAYLNGILIFTVPKSKWSEKENKKKVIIY